MSDSCNPMDCSLPGSFVYGILQARILEWLAISFSRGSSQCVDWTWVFYISCMACGFFTAEPPGKPLECIMLSEKARQNKYYMIPLTCGILKSQTQKNKKKWWSGTRSWGNRERLIKGHTLSAIRWIRGSNEMDETGAHYTEWSKSER